MKIYTHDHSNPDTHLCHHYHRLAAEQATTSVLHCNGLGLQLTAVIGLENHSDPQVDPQSIKCKFAVPVATMLQH